MSNPHMALENVVCGYSARDWRLRVEDLVLHEGEFVGIVGPNGAGKSTLLRTMAGLSSPEQGTVKLHGKALPEYNRMEAACNVGFLPQHNESLFDRTVRETAELGRYPRVRGAMLGMEDHDAVAQALALCGMAGMESRRLSELSGGERKRALLSGLLAQNPRILLLDEPGAALDMNHQASLFQLLRTLAREGASVAVVTHELNMASLFCDRLWLIGNGQVVSSGDPLRVMQDSTLAATFGGAFETMRHPSANRIMLLPREEN